MRFDHSGLVPQTRSEIYGGGDAYRAGELGEVSPLAAKLDSLGKNWTKLLLMKVPDHLVKMLRDRKMKVQYAHNESYSNDLNIDQYPVRIDRFPTHGGTQMTPAALLKYIRLNINSLLDTSLSKFRPYVPPDAMRWVTDDPVGTVMYIEIPGDNAAVLCSSATPTGWTFTTVDTPASGTHPVSGHRTFFMANRNGVHYFAVKGLDMLSSGIAGMGVPIVGELGYRQADKLWQSLQRGVTHFVNSNGGAAKVEKRYSQRIEWRYVYYRYRNALENVFGKGAGSAGKSKFVDIVD
jgi:hypothetical protein